MFGRKKLGINDFQLVMRANSVFDILCIFEIIDINSNDI